MKVCFWAGTDTWSIALMECKGKWKRTRSFVENVLLEKIKSCKNNSNDHQIVNNLSTTWPFELPCCWEVDVSMIHAGKK